MRQLRRAAAQRGLSVPVLVDTLLEAIVQDRLVDAVLDDRPS